LCHNYSNISTCTNRIFFGKDVACEYKGGVGQEKEQEGIERERHDAKKHNKEKKTRRGRRERDRSHSSFPDKVEHQTNADRIGSQVVPM
jgi:hypothetical protein